MTRTDPAPMPARQPAWGLVLGGVCWIVSLEFLVGQAIAQAAWTTPYSLTDDVISDLGNTACGEWPPVEISGTPVTGVGTHYYVCSPLHTVMNISFIATGILLLLGLYLTRSIWPRRRLTAWGLVFLTLAGVGKIVVGLDPENVRLVFHSLGGLGIPCADIGMLLLGLAVWSTRRGVGLFSVSLGSLGLLAYVAAIALSTSPHGVGAAERVADYPVIIWMVGLGIGCVIRSGSSTGSAPTSTVS